MAATGAPEVTDNMKMKPMMSRKGATRTAAVKDPNFRNLADELLANTSQNKKAGREQEEKSLGMRLLDNDLSDLLGMERNAKTAI